MPQVEVVETIDVEALSSPFDWDYLLDGAIHVLLADAIKCKPSSLRAMAHYAANVRHVVVSTCFFEGYFLIKAIR